MIAITIEINLCPNHIVLLHSSKNNLKMKWSCNKSDHNFISRPLSTTTTFSCYSKVYIECLKLKNFFVIHPTTPKGENYILQYDFTI